jgi:SNF2 family DNA or RNA helicase
MHAVHGFWSRQRGLCLWAEDSRRPVKSSSQAIRSARPHPFAAPAQDLAKLHGGIPGTALLLLPSLRTAPLDSPELVRTRPRPDPTRRPTLACWSTPVCVFDPPAALTVLDNPVQDARYGASLRHLRELASFARDLTERGRVLPTVADFGDQSLARWRPVLQGPDVVVLHGLVAALPPICRAEVDDPTDLRGQSPDELVTAALHALVDAAVRERLAATGISTDGRVPRRGRRPKRTPAAQSWLQALGGPDGLFEADPDDVLQLTGALAPWHGFGVGRAGPARVTFRLTETPAAGPIRLDGDESDETGSPTVPESAESAWRLEFLLQSLQDPSLLVPAQQVWKAGNGLRRWLERPDELLLTELGRASTIYPELTGALRQARPDAMSLTPEAVFEFLSGRADLLDQAGFGVLLPSWWTRRRKLSLTASAMSAPDGGVTEGMFSREALCRFSWQLAIGDEPLTGEELAALAATKAPLIRLRGEWVAVDPEQIRRGLEFLREQAARADEEEGRRTVAEVIALATSHPDDLDTPLPVSSVRADGWLGDLLSGSVERSLEPIDPPAGFGANLRPYQQRGLSWLAFLADLGLGACLADDMGLGKTVQLLALESVVRDRAPRTGPTLLVCPMSLVGNWQREAARFAPSLTVYAHHGPDRLRGDEFSALLSGVDIVVTTYQTATRDIDDLVARSWGRVVLDEAQAIKNDLSRSAKAVRRLAADHRVALTGTPMENRLAELWSVMDFLNPGILGSADLFRARYAKPIERYGQTEPVQRLRAVTRPYILRRLKTDKTIIDDLPDKIEIKQYCHLTAEQAALYQSVVDEMMPKIEQSAGIERRGNILAAMTKLKQICNHPAQLLHDGSEVGRRSGKVIRLEEILDEIIAEGDKALLFTQYTEFADMLLPRLAARFGRDVLYLHGKTAKKHRDDMVRRFQSDDGPPIFLLSLRAGGVGLNLTAANHVIHLDRWWNPAVENQATDRAFRIGQRRNVQVRKFICTGTLEDRIDQMIEKKKALADLVISDGEGWLTELSTQELRAVFALGEEAVGE